MKAENVALKKRLQRMDVERLEVENDHLKHRVRELGSSETAKKKDIKELRKDLVHCEVGLPSVEKEKEKWEHHEEIKRRQLGILEGN